MLLSLLDLKHRVKERRYFMSVVVAIKHNGAVYLGADSQVTRGGTRSTLKNPNNFKIWAVKNSNNCLMGHVGNVRDANVIRLMSNIIDDYDEYIDNINFSFVVKFLVPEMIKNLEKAKYLKIKDNYFDGFDSSFLFAYKDRLFLINEDGTVLEIEDYCAIGSGASEAIGSLLSTENEEPLHRIIKAIKASAAHDIYVDYPIVLNNTNDCKFTILGEDNIEEFMSGGDK